VKLSRLAPAKVNLFLHVGPPGGDGYHPIASLMAFADIGDRLTIGAADYPAFETDGPFAPVLGDELNLVEQAWGALAAHVRTPMPPFRLILTKELPVAAGLGGGSSDAGAALRLIRDGLRLAVDDRTLARLAGTLGADGPACLLAQPVLAEGRGDELSPAPVMPAVDAVLVNPGVACSTAAVYRAYDRTGAFGDSGMPGLPTAFEDVSELAAVLSFCRNDLEPPAIGVAPEIGIVLDTLRSAPETLLARMSGSGATCFAICASDYDAEALAEQISVMAPNWWVRRCRLGAPRAD
jgi:4-diphosphocytidyl-2-C-methyl-D-erythritol kinase